MYPSRRRTETTNFWPNVSFETTNDRYLRFIQRSKETRDYYYNGRSVPTKLSSKTTTGYGVLIPFGKTFEVQ